MDRQESLFRWIKGIYKPPILDEKPKDCSECEHYYPPAGKGQTGYCDAYKKHVWVKNRFGVPYHPNCPRGKKKQKPAYTY